ncbi:hypothetical protein Smp_077000 [Schistosoma mansoni]|uniref:hypothetical protein n=1 Tax=Schistosoma mansoni TaxID=6183 RepID=UPI0001A61F7E|nr:hypothetical protein Smp_077000 [Schistosoma mansoni]|eukprot:XP_018645950.1 hypothetical protein Smp_077000 [Schistosoma mansoni]
MDFLTCASCMRNGICLPVTSVKCMVGNELIFCQNKEYFNGLMNGYPISKMKENDAD